VFFPFFPCYPPYFSPFFWNYIICVCGWRWMCGRGIVAHYVECTTNVVKEWYGSDCDNRGYQGRRSWVIKLLRFHSTCLKITFFLPPWRRVPGLPPSHQRLRKKLWQSWPKAAQAERNRCDRKDDLWVFVFGSRTGYIWALIQLSLFTHNSDRSVDNYFSIFVQHFPPNGT